jgi:hypothetical protein
MAHSGRGSGSSKQYFGQYPSQTSPPRYAIAVTVNELLRALAKVGRRIKNSVIACLPVTSRATIATPMRLRVSRGRVVAGTQKPRVQHQCTRLQFSRQLERYRQRRLRSKGRRATPATKKPRPSLRRLLAEPVKRRPGSAEHVPRRGSDCSHGDIEATAETHRRPPAAAATAPCSAPTRGRILYRFALATRSISSFFLMA